MPTAEASRSTAALAELRVDHDTIVVVLAGEWSLARASPRFSDLVESSTAVAPAVTSMSFDAGDLGSWDSSLLIFLSACQRFCEDRFIGLDTSALPEQVPRLLALARAVPERAQMKAPEPPVLVTRMGTAALGVWSETLGAVRFTGEVAIAMAGLPTQRVHMRWREFWVVVQTNSSGALPIVTLIALLVGVIIAFLGVVVLKRFGASYYVSYLVGFGMLREMGALMTGIIIAGRTGAAFAAELGSMKSSEEIDAYTTLGISPIEHLVLPRVLGLIVMMPLLTIYADVFGILGGLFVSNALLDLSAKQFLTGLLQAVTLSDAAFGVVKGTTYGIIVAVAGCMKGLRAGADARAVGRAATSAVVVGITIIVIANAVADWLAAVLDI